MDLDPVKACLTGALRSVTPLLGDIVDLVDSQGPRGVVFARDAVEPLARHGDIARADRLLTGTKGRRRGTTRVPELREDEAALLVDGVGDLFPGGYLRVGEAAGGTRVVAGVLEDVSGLGELQAAFCGALAVVVDNEVVGYRDAIALLSGAHARQGRLSDAVLKLERSQLEGGEEARVLERAKAWGGVCRGHCVLGHTKRARWQFESRGRVVVMHRQ